MALRGRLIKREKVQVDGKTFDFEDEGYQCENSEFASVDPKCVPEHASEGETQAQAWAGHPKTRSLKKARFKESFLVVNRVLRIRQWSRCPATARFLRK